jgi:hypothetical protein
MKRLVTLLIFFASSAVVRAQETTQFTAALRGNSDWLGAGTFTLTGSSFTYDVNTPYSFDFAAIHGPAQSGMDAPKIFDLDSPSCVPPAPGGEFRGGCYYSGSFALTEEQISQLST